jgi:predicted GNAT family acetyltransferase
MRCRLLDDSARFLDLAGPFLAQREAENTVLLGAALRCRRGSPDDVVMLVVQDGVAVALAAIMTPPHALVVSTGEPQAIASLVEAVGEAGLRLPGVFGLAPMAEHFALSWCKRTRAEARPETQSLLYRACRIVLPASVPGALRTAAASDAEWLTAWQRRFAAQAGLSAAERAADIRGITAARIARGEMVFWALADRPVACAAFVPTTAAGDGGRINAVFTPEEERGKGYASACVAALSQRLLAQGWRYCLMFADRRNAITNRIYPRLGYEEIGGFTNIGFRYGG